MMTKPMTSLIFSPQSPSTANLRNDWPISLAHHRENSSQALPECASPQVETFTPAKSISVISSSPLKKSTSRSNAVKPAPISKCTPSMPPQLDSSSARQKHCSPIMAGATAAQRSFQSVPSPTVCNSERQFPLQRQVAAHSPTANSLPLNAEQTNSPLKRIRSEMDGNETPRGKITIDYIDDDRSRQVTFLKRKNGVMKKAMELSILCDCKVAVLVYSKDTSKMFEYSSHDMVQILSQYAEYGGSEDNRCAAEDGADIRDDIHGPKPFSFRSSEEVAPAPSQRNRKRRVCDDNDDGQHPQKKHRKASENVSPLRTARSPTTSPQHDAMNRPSDWGAATGSKDDGPLLDQEAVQKHYPHSAQSGSDEMILAWMLDDAKPPVVLPSPIVNGKTIIDDCSSSPVGPI